MKKKELINQITDLKIAYNMLNADLKAAVAHSERTEQHIISCENANNELHEKVTAYQVVVKDLN